MPRVRVGGWAYLFTKQEKNLLPVSRKPKQCHHSTIQHGEKRPTKSSALGNFISKWSAIKGNNVYFYCPGPIINKIAISGILTQWNLDFRAGRILKIHILFHLVTLFLCVFLIKIHRSFMKLLADATMGEE